jgi:hypothetical protein
MSTARTRFSDIAPWETLQHAYGPAGDVPPLLEQIAASRGRELNGLFGELCSRVLHQGTIYSASAPAVLALIQMILDVAASDRIMYYGLLAAFADSARMAIEDGPAPPCHAGGHPDDGAAIRRELDEARGLFESMLADPDAQVRAEIVRLLTAFRDADPASAMGVRQRYFAEEDLDVRCDMLVGLTRVRAAFNDWPAFLGMALDGESEPENRFLIRYAQVVEWRMDAESTAVDDLVACFVCPNRTGAYPFTRDQRFFEAVRVLGTDRELAALRKAVALGDGEKVLRVVAEHLLRLVFEDRRTGWGKTASSGHKGVRNIEYWGLKGAAPTIPLKLNESQRVVLGEFAEKPGLWQFRTNLWALFGLPDDGAGLERFVREH